MKTADRTQPRQTGYDRIALIPGWLTLLIICITILVGCASPQATQAVLNVTVQVDGKEIQVRVPAGSTVQDALTAAGLTVGQLDRLEPSTYTVLKEGVKISLVRVTEEFKVEQSVIPFEHQVLRNESMPEGESRLVQPGVNGVQETTYRHLYEDGKEVSTSPVKTLVIKDAVPEIMMVGTHSPFSSYPLPGKLVYLMNGNAWVIEGTTGNRRPIVTTGDLDGSVFSLSPDGSWLLFTRHAKQDTTINTLWSARTDQEGSQLVDLKVSNIVHYAGWKPGSAYIIAYSTVEARPSAPGWQANNDLNLLSMNRSGETRTLPAMLDTNMGGNYGWWGMTFAWSPDGSAMAYTRPDSVGLLIAGKDPGKGVLNSSLDIIPLQTHSDWAWVPGLTWAPNGKTLFTVKHVPTPGAASPEESTSFDLAAIPLSGGPTMSLVSQAGMFAYPLASPFQTETLGGDNYQVAYLQAIFPDQSDTSRTHVAVIDQDGSNRKLLFPAEGAPGMDPQQEWGAWSPAPMPDNGDYSLAVIYQKNIWLVDAATGSARQITGDNQVSRLDWK
jgi:hypothetical protein